MTLSEPAQIWVVDPGLMEAGGHHAALAETLCQNLKQGFHTGHTQENIRVYAHKQLDKRLQAQFTGVGVEINLHFDTVFYQHFHDASSLGPAGLQAYVRQLCREYGSIILKAIRHSSQQRIVLFYPCLNWEHAWALNMAITMCNKHIEQAELHFVCCAMYSPAEPAQLSNKKVWFRLGFRELAVLPYISLYASEFELCQAYQDLLNCAEIKLHPCYLMDWSSPDLQTSIDSEFKLPAKTVLLYLGDAKEDKGFNRLPEVLTNALANTSKDTYFLIQFTLAWAYPEITESINRLKEWVKTEPRLLLHQGFWSNDQLAYVVNSISLAICTYDTSVYQNKSSGLLWMLAYFERSFIIDAPCWLTREAQRLGVQYQIAPNLNIRDVQVANDAITEQNVLYRQAMFEPLMSWLVNH